MNQVLVTGCAGFIGSHVVDELLLMGYSVVGIDNFDDYYPREVKERNIEVALKSDAFKFFETDILDREGLDRVFFEYKMDRVIHLAALAGVRNSFENPTKYFKVNVEGSRSVFETGLQNGVRHFLHASSSSVYGEMSGGKAVEDETPLNPISPYAKSKVEAEELIHSLQAELGFDVNVLRFFTVYGPRQRPDMAFPKFRRQLKAGETIELYGENMRRDFTHIDRIVEGIIAALQYSNGFEIFNLASGQPVLVKDMIMKIGEELGIEPHIKIIGQQEGDPSYTYADVSKMMERFFRK